MLVNSDAATGKLLRKREKPSEMFSATGCVIVFHHHKGHSLRSNENKMSYREQTVRRSVSTVEVMESWAKWRLAVSSIAWLGQFAISICGRSDDFGVGLGDYNVILVICPSKTRCLDASLNSEVHSGANLDRGIGHDPRRPPIKSQTVPPSPAHRMPGLAMPSGIGRLRKYLLAATRDRSKGLAGTQQLGACVNAVPNGVQNLLLLCGGRLPSHTRPTKVE
jgi:hypothetical protein